METKNNFLIYGAYGYTGELIAELAVKKGLQPILAGRNVEKTKALADILDLKWIAFEATDKTALKLALQREEIKVVLNCAGPFTKTVKEFIPACIAAKVHYLDITGEIEVFEYAKTQDKEAKEAEIMIMSGVGFDVVPSDCLAKFLKDELPTATHLELAFMGLAGVSQGTAITMVENAGAGGMIRENGTIKIVKTAYQTKVIDYGIKKMNSVAIPWGDVSTAFHSTQIPNIKVFMAQPPKAIKAMEMSSYFSFALKNEFVKGFIKKKIKEREKGPNEEKRDNNHSYLWGKVTDGKNTLEARLITPEGYKLTSIAALLITEKVLNSDYKMGYQTPSSTYGKNLILEVEGTEMTLV
ncbi:saccharopine dehydrogenase NADP-binding domain-containing protein [Bernardetia sp. ABR2-2B]|uniref:saccharopine dehydrogenase family protein n=1 Tax=Bernardetia sp. ABR2-2B TaxID=3127472 RepID=UPI0030CAC3AD